MNYNAKNDIKQAHFSPNLIKLQPNEKIAYYNTTIKGKKNETID